MATKKSEVDFDTKLKYSHLHLDWDNIDWDQLHRPFKYYKTEEQYIEILKAIRNIDNLYFTCKYILNIDPVLFQIVCLETLFKYPFPMIIASRGLSKSFMLALFLLLRGLIIQPSKSVIVGAAFRQSKVVFEYMESIWNNAPVLRDLCGDSSGPKRSTDVWVFKIGDSTVSALPLGDGSKIRGQRANCIVGDEFQSLPELIYEIVVSGFASVSASPAENVKKFAKIAYLQQQGIFVKEQENVFGGIYRGNQAILAGTGDWGFKHFAKYWKRYKNIINSRGDMRKLQEIFEGNVESSFNWKDYAVIRIPIELAPPGFMDEKHIQRSKLQNTHTIFMQEYGACFVEDSDKFYRRSLVESCVCKDPIDLPSGKVQFHAVVHGSRSRRYIYGVDPASETDNFSIIILELHEDHRRVVYCWTTTREKHMAKVRSQAVDDNAFYAYCARKIRELMSIFPCEYISLDSQGGGIAVMEALHDKKSLQPGELPIWTITHKQGREDNPVLWPGSKDYGHDGEPGLHLIEMVSMAKSDYVSEANHGMKRDFESKVLLFPYFDPISLSEATEIDLSNRRLYDTLEECVLEIEELKNELSTIDHVTTPNGRDKWTTPNIILPGNKIEYLRKDRFSALLMANALARRISNIRVYDHQHVPAGGFITDLGNKDYSKSEFYTGPSWFTSKTNDWGVVIPR